jgi:hypothetical protein
MKLNVKAFALACAVGLGLGCLHPDMVAHRI